MKRFDFIFKRKDSYVSFSDGSAKRENHRPTDRDINDFEASTNNSNIEIVKYSKSSDDYFEYEAPKETYTDDFFKSQLSFLRSEFETISKILRYREDAEEKNFLVSSLRSQLHPLQINSESFYLEKFNTNKDIPYIAFIKADLCDSVSLNQFYGETLIENVLDNFLEEYWQKNKSKGVIAQRNLGDELSLYFAPTQYDSSVTAFIDKVETSVIDFFKMAEQLSDTVSNHGINSKFLLKFYLGLQLKSSSSAYRNINLATGTAFDLSNRVLGNVAAPGELIISEEFYSFSQSKKLFFQIRPTRLRGSLVSLNLYMYTGDFKDNAA